MSCYNIIISRRSIRRFKQKRIAYGKLKKMVEAARLAPSASNLQPLEYIIVDKKEVVDKLFSSLRWASYLKDKGAPPEGMRPVAHIVALMNKKIAGAFSGADAASAVSNILIVATEEKLGSCWLGAIDREAVARLLEVPAKFSVEYVVALGYPDEVSVREKIKRGDVRYWRDANGKMHVPKRRLEDILQRNAYRRKK